MAEKVACGQPTFVACGAHIEQVLGDVPAGDRCKCREEEKAAGSDQGGGAAGSWLKSLFGK